jgi:hypothetical protein
MSEEKKAEPSVKEVVEQVDKKDEFKPEDYIHYDHERNGYKFRMYIAKDMPTGLAYEGSIDYLNHFRALHWKKVAEQIKKEQEANLAESVDNKEVMQQEAAAE